ncbi:simple sugar transport system permease protein [Aequitasia blattaphilus]|uniref:ABC transporter permease n=1 Tax=Aequitasia blattaphilus TaxID=2949332 RepID=A0ABT1EA17_9FIRM|nr:ABC transporter permease [Aequitasia blattaphilus]MCP1102694.1 ABC transporter permease [Aequitasia blattaphilus]MCR8615334.1 ABC transporter permease [Aequitasia blattaphilus]
MNRTGKKIDDNILRLLVVLVVFVLIACTTKTSMFMQVGNFQSIGKQLAEYGLMALGVGICMISGGIDLSTVYIANLCGIVSGLMMQRLIPQGEENSGIVILAMLTAIVIGALCGAFNGFLISKLNIPAMLATLGTYQLYMGIAVVISGGSTVSGLPKGYTALGTTLVGGIPLAFLVFLVAAIVLSFIMSKTKFGTRVYLVGTNEKSAVFAGIKKNSTLIRTYMISGVISAIAGLVSLARINSAKADFGSSYTMQCILIVVLGGVNPNGGFGSIPGVAIAVVILQVLSSYLNMFPDISNYFRDLIWGVALIAVLIINFVINKRKTARLAKLS